MSDGGSPDPDPRDGEDVDDSGEPAVEDPLDRLAEDFAARFRRGESPSIEEYAGRHPELASRIRDILPTVAMMEQLKRRPFSPSGRDAGRPLPDRIGGFRILRELGRGGMGIVYEAVQEPLGRHIALKVIHQVHADPRRLLRFSRETQAVAQLHHTNIVPIFAVGEHEGLPFFAMQCIRGEGLDAILKRWREGGSPGPGDGPERWRFAAKVGLQAAEAIQHAHDQGVLHRDLKPANLLIDEDGAVWVTDFGLAKLSGHDDLTDSGDVIGTLRYLAPEALRGVSGPRGDVYSLGITLYEMLTLRPPFGDVTPGEILHRVGEGRIVRPRVLDPAIPSDLETIVLKATAREPDRRYQTAGALADDLRRFLEDRPILARRASMVERAWRWSRRNRSSAALIAVAASAVLLAAVVGCVGYAREVERRRESDESADIMLAFVSELVELFADKEEVIRQYPRSPRSDGAGPGGPEPPPDANAPGDAPPLDSPRDRGKAADSEILRRIVRFYDQLAGKKGTASGRRGEAAWALFRIGGHDEKFNRIEAAEAECDRALGIFEEMAASQPDDPDDFVKLTRFPDMVAPEEGNEPSLRRKEKRLRRLGRLIDRLASTRPDDAGMARARVRWRMALGVDLGRLGRPDESERELVDAVNLAEELVGRWDEDPEARITRLEARFALARFLMGRKLYDRAWDILRQTPAELDLLKSRGVSSALIADHLEGLASWFYNLQQIDRSTQLMTWSNMLDPRPREGEPLRPDGGPRVGVPGPSDRPEPETGPKPTPAP